jgi:apolipoprotein N-acyltransferase
MLDRLLRVAVTLAAAAALSAISTPIGWWPFHAVVYLPMFWVMRPEMPKENARYAWLYGTFGTALLFRWLVDTITLFSNIPWIGAVGILLLFGAAFGSPWVLVWSALHPLRRRFGRGWMLAWPALWILIDYVASFVLLFPYQHGVTLYRTLPAWQLVSVTGIWGPTFLWVVTNAVLGEALLAWRAGEKPPVRALATAALVWAAVIGWGSWRVASVEEALSQADTLRVAQLQSTHGMDYRMGHPASEAFDEWVDRTRRVPPGSVDLVVWPEGACPYDLNVSNSKASKILGELAREGQYALLVGAGAREPKVGPDGKRRTKNFNTVYLYGPNGEQAGRYDKMVPLPFGEYLPFSETFPWIGDLIRGPGDFEAGRVPTIFEAGRARIASPICYEAILGRVCRLFEQPDLLVNVTNDAWFLDTAAPHQHAMLAAERATELGIPMFRSAYTGVSMVVEPHGQIYAETTPFTDVAQIVTVRLGRVSTVYGALGDWFVGACAIGLGAAWAATRVRRTAER